jgi:hypothetical protein
MKEYLQRLFGGIYYRQLVIANKALARKSKQLKRAQARVTELTRELDLATNTQQQDHGTNQVAEASPVSEVREP